MRLSSRGLAGAVLLSLVAACTTPPKPVEVVPTPTAPPAPTPEPPAVSWASAAFSDLPGWADDDLLPAFSSFRTGCSNIGKRAASDLLGNGALAPRVSDWLGVCTAAGTVDGKDPAAVRSFFESNFKLLSLRAKGSTDGLFTGYYEPWIEASRTETATFNVPVYGRPADLVMVELGEFRPSYKGQRIAGRVKGGQLKPYEDRAAIDKGALKGKAPIVMYAKSAVDLFFLQVQGSGRVKLADGSETRIGYDGQNGHPYTAIGKVLKDRGTLTGAVTMPLIKDWLAANPAEAPAILNRNASYVFFREMAGLDPAIGPTGSLNVPLTAGRSLAVDRTVIPLGAPVFVVTELPEGGGPFRRLMMAQDTGGAIAGAVRGDIFFGHGPDAEKLAGAMQGKGQLYVLIPAEAVIPEAAR